jgi:hypothetical protein
MDRWARVGARSTAAAVVVVYFALLVLLGGPREGWRHLGVPTLSPSFADLRSITSGWECTRRGIEVLESNPCDPWERPANYPRIWMAPSILGLGQESTIPLGILEALVFLAAAFALIPKAAPLIDGLVYGAAIVSPAVMLGVERGNVDISLFALVVLAVLLLELGGVWLYVSSALLLLAAILKLFPIFATGVLARQRDKTAVVMLGVILAVFGLYAIVTLDDIRTIATVVPQVTHHSYGAAIVGDMVGSSLDGLSSEAWGLTVVIAIVVAAVALRPRLRAWLPGAAQDGDSARALDLFWAGAPVFLFTFALFRSFNYRLVFLLMTIPMLLRFARQRRVVGAATLVLVLATLWLPGTPARIAEAEMAARFAGLAALGAFGGLVAVLVATTSAFTTRRARREEKALDAPNAPA